MKTAISVPDSIYQAAEQLAKRLNISRSELYSKAISSYLNAEEKSIVTETLNEIYAKEASNLPEFIQNMQLKSLGNEPW